MSDSLIDGVMVAAIYGGAKDPFNMTPDEVEVTRELLRKQLPLLRYWWTAPPTWRTRWRPASSSPPARGTTRTPR